MSAAEASEHAWLGGPVAAASTRAAAAAEMADRARQRQADKAERQKKVKRIRRSPAMMRNRTAAAAAAAAEAGISPTSSSPKLSTPRTIGSDGVVVGSAVTSGLTPPLLAAVPGRISMNSEASATYTEVGMETLSSPRTQKMVSMPTVVVDDAARKVDGLRIGEGAASSGTRTEDSAGVSGGSVLAGRRRGERYSGRNGGRGGSGMMMEEKQGKRRL